MQVEFYWCRGYCGQVIHQPALGHHHGNRQSPRVRWCVAVFVALSRLVSRARLVLRVVPWASYGVIAAWYMLKQYRNSYPIGVEWPDAFHAMHAVALVALLTLVADAVLRRSGAPDEPHTTAGGQRSPRWRLGKGAATSCKARSRPESTIQDFYRFCQPH